jgi:hypothetical protein
MINMANMYKIYALYSKTRKVCYLHDQSHNEFWSLYLRFKYPNDKWFVIDTDSIVYIDLMQNKEERERTKFINLYDDKDFYAFRIKKQILDARDMMAKEFLKTKMDVKANDLFLVFRSSRGEAVVLYNGPDIDSAFDIYESKTGCEGVEFWRDGKFMDTLYTKDDYYRKYKAQKTS